MWQQVAKQLPSIWVVQVTLYIAGTLICINTSNLEIPNNTITINESGGTESAGESGINVQE